MTALHAPTDRAGHSAPASAVQKGLEGGRGRETTGWDGNGEIERTCRESRTDRTTESASRFTHWGENKRQHLDDRLAATSLDLDVLVVCMENT